jgi:four helix bundle protein
MSAKKFEDFPVWQASMKVTKRVYDLSARPDFCKDFGLRDQIRRAVVSISSNVVEGFEKNNSNEFQRYLRIAKGSTGEARNQLYIARAVNYITEDEFISVNGQLEDIASQIVGLIQ